MIGDIALIHSREGKKSLGSEIGQRIVTGDFRTDAYTHVALLLGKYKAVHAMPAPDHIELTVVHELLDPADRWVVWRHRDWSQRVNEVKELHHKFLWAAERHVGEHYNNPSQLQPNEHHSFCSELIGKVYAKFEMPFADPPERLMPIAIAAAVQRTDGWVSVSDEYRALLQNDPRFTDLHHEDSDRQRLALQAAKLVAKNMMFWTEAIDRIRRFNHWEVEDHGGGLQSWTRKSKDALRDPIYYERETLEWLSLLMEDEVNPKLVEMFLTLPDRARRSGRRSPPPTPPSQ